MRRQFNMRRFVWAECVRFALSQGKTVCIASIRGDIVAKRGDGMTEVEFIAHDRLRGFNSAPVETQVTEDKAKLA